MQKLIQIELGILIFLTPLIFITDTYDNFDLPKITFVRILTIVILLTYLIFAVVDRNRDKELYKIKIFKVSLPVIVFILFVLISTLISIDRPTSMLGMYRFYFSGWSSILCFAIIYFFTMKYYNAKLFINIICFSGLIVSVYGLSQFFGVDSFGWNFVYPYRAFSTLGNPVYLGSFLIMVIPLLLYNFDRKKNTFLWFIAYIIVFSCLLTTLCRSAWVGFLVSIVFYFIFVKNKLKYIPVIISTVLITIIFFQPVNKKVSPVLDRTVNLVNRKESSNLARIATWHAGVNMLFDRIKIKSTGYADNLLYLIFGSGPDTFFHLFPHYRGRDHILSAGRNITSASAHNEILQIIITLGIAGLVMYFLVLMSFALSTFKGCSLLSIALLSGILAILIHSQFNFSTVSTSLYFWLFGGIIIGQSLNKENVEKSK